MTENWVKTDSDPIGYMKTDTLFNESFASEEEVIKSIVSDKFKEIDKLKSQISVKKWEITRLWDRINIISNHDKD